MKINHSAIRSVIKFTALALFIASIMWRLYNLMKHGGTLESQDTDPRQTPTPASDDDDEDEDEDS